MHHDPMVLQFCDEMRKADRLPELELARQQEEKYNKHYLPENDKKPQLRYVMPKKKRTQKKAAEHTTDQPASATAKFNKT